MKLKLVVAVCALLMGTLGWAQPRDNVIKGELFPKGLTLVDYADPSQRKGMTLSHIAARQELRDLMDNLRLQGRDDAGLAKVS